MRRIRLLAPFLFGFMLATLAGIILRASPVMAQQAWSDLSISKPPLMRPERPMRAAAPSVPVDEAPPQPALIPTGINDILPPVEPTAAAASRPRIVERAQDDGETEPPVGVDLAVDGHMEVTEPEPSLDGREAFAGDPRLPQDRAAFLSPPAGYDALAFQIELDPATDARPARLTTLEPYAAVGRRAGSWVVFPTVEAGIGGTTNVYRSASPKPALIFDVRPTLLAVTDWQQHALQFKATGVGSAYPAFASENEHSYAFEARGRLDLSRRSNIEVLASHSFDQEPRSSLFSPADAKTPIPYTTDKFAIAFNQRFNRLSLQLRGAVTEFDYRAVGTTDGNILSNADRDLSAREVAVRATWSFSPALAAFADAALNSQQYRSAPADGITRDSNGDRVKVGLSFGTLSQIWRGEIAAGYGHQNSSDGRLKSVEGLLLDANLGWKPTALTSLLFKARTDFLTSTEPGQGNATQRLGGVELRHAFRRQLVGIAGLSYQETGSQGIALIERQTTAEVGFEYYVSQSTTLLGRFAHVATDSTAVDANTTTDSVRLGVRYRP